MDGDAQDGLRGQPIARILGRGRGRGRRVPRLVQYYFGTKEELLLAAMQYLAAQFGGRAMARIKRIKGTGGQASPRDVIAAILTEAPPVDDERRTFTVLNAAYFALSLTEPALAITPWSRTRTP